MRQHICLHRNVTNVFSQVLSGIHSNHIQQTPPQLLENLTLGSELRLYRFTYRTGAALTGRGVWGSSSYHDSTDPLPCNGTINGDWLTFGGNDAPAMPDCREAHTRL